jgi:hypothetical protein
LLCKSVTDARNRLDGESAVRFSQAAHSCDAAIDCIFADDTPGPALFDQLIARDDLTAPARKRNQHLHDAGLKHLTFAEIQDLARGGPYLKSAEREVRLNRQID